MYIAFTAAIMAGIYTWQDFTKQVKSEIYKVLIVALLSSTVVAVLLSIIVVLF